MPTLSTSISPIHVCLEVATSWARHTQTSTWLRCWLIAKWVSFHTLLDVTSNGQLAGASTLACGIHCCSHVRLIQQAKTDVVRSIGFILANTFHLSPLTLSFGLFILSLRHSPSHSCPRFSGQPGFGLQGHQGVGVAPATRPILLVFIHLTLYFFCDITILSRFCFYLWMNYIKNFFIFPDQDRSG